MCGIATNPDTKNQNTLVTLAREERRRDRGNGRHIFHEFGYVLQPRLESASTAMLEHAVMVILSTHGFQELVISFNIAAKWVLPAPTA
jgi:hypothetical protein